MVLPNIFIVRSSDGQNQVLPMTIPSSRSGVRTTDRCGGTPVRSACAPLRGESVWV